MTGESGDPAGRRVTPEELAAFERSRGRLEAIAYRLLGSASEAEDAVQETYLRWQAADRAAIDVPEAWLTRVLTNLCLSQLRSARARREVYTGQWLPEPVLEGDPMLGPADTVEQRDSVSTAMLMLMERLGPLERAVYVLREAFGHTHAEIADLLGVTESNSQQVLHRAKQHLASASRRRDVDQRAARALVEEFLTAAMSGRTEALVPLLTSGARGVGDGGGHVPARATPVTGAVELAKFLRGLFRPAEAKRRYLGGTPALYATTANGDPALLAVVNGEIAGVLVLEVTDDGINGVLNQVNPEKLGRATRRWTDAGHDAPLIASW